MNRLRKGMWVVVGGKIAIISSFGFDDKLGDVAEVHYVNDEGLTFLVDPRVPVSTIAQAAVGDIPEARRPNEVVARKFGYA